MKSFDFKWYEFLALYGILNLILFSSINSSISSMYENFSKLSVSGFVIDGSDLSVFANIFAAPLIVLLAIISAGFVLLEEFIAILLLKFVYFASMVKDEEKARLYRYMKITLLYFILANIIGVMFWGDIQRAILFIFLYLPFLFFTFIFICLKMKGA